MNKYGVALVGAAMLALEAGVAQGIDLTGTWTTANGKDVKCTYFNGQKQRSVDGNLSTLYITQVGSDIYIEIDKGSLPVYDNTFGGKVVEATKNSNKAEAAATACFVAGESYYGTMHIPRAKTTPDKLSMDFVGVNNSIVLMCSGKFIRSNLSDPNVPTTCP